jgi:hypothetical protein
MFNLIFFLCAAVISIAGTVMVREGLWKNKKEWIIIGFCLVICGLSVVAAIIANTYIVR